jgi:hypothetical protein
MRRPAMNRPGRPLARLALALALAGAAGPTHAASQSVAEFWPEIDVFVKLDDRWRLFLLASSTQASETGEKSEGTLGVHIDYFASHLPEWSQRMLPKADQRFHLMLRAGYQRLAQAGGGREDRGVVEATLRSDPLLWDTQLANRSRFDLRSIDGDASWRYRNRTRIERTWSPTAALGDTVGGAVNWVGAKTLTPYAMYEFFWDSRESRWNRRYAQVGIEFEVRNNRSLDIYLAHQEQTRSAGSSLTALGVTFTLKY